jgi:hypothetical protein
MPKNHPTKGTSLKSRKRTNKEFDEEKPAKLKRSRKNIEEHECKKQEEELPEDYHTISRSLSEKAAKAYKVVAKIMNEFNCNSQEPKIYCRNYEKSQIQEYIDDNFKESKSGLMYV